MRIPQYAPALTEKQLMDQCPSIFSIGHAENLSNRYTHIPTIEIVKEMSKSGFLPYKATQTRVRDENLKGFTRHMIRFRNTESSLLVGEVLPEVVLINSHDGLSAYQIRAGFYRLVCSNGLMVGDDVSCYRVRHKGDIVQNVISAAKDIIEVLPLSVKKIEEWKQIDLHPMQQKAFAKSAAQLKWQTEEPEIQENIADSLLGFRRYADTGVNLWTTYNRIQENLIQGGIRYKTDDGDSRRTRGVNSIQENVRINTGLWNLAEAAAQGHGRLITV